MVVLMDRHAVARFVAVAAAGVMSAVSAWSQINTDQVMRIGRNALYFEDYVLAIQYFNSVIAAKPYLAQPYFYRSLGKFYLDDYKGAEQDVTMALERNPFLTDAYELRGVLRQNTGRAEEAVADYDKALEMMPQNRGILFNKSLALQDMGDYDRAGESYETLLRLHPGFADGYLGRARMYLAKKDTVAAKADIDHALEIDKNAVNGYIMRADIAINSAKDYEQALADMDQAIRLQPKYAGFFINRAFLRHELDDYYGAMSDYDYALQLDPLNTMAMFNRAMLRAEVHDYNRAIDDLDCVERLRGADFRILYNRAIIRKEVGQYKEAIADIDRVIEAYPELAAGYFLRYDIRRDMGDPKAQADYDKSLALAKKKVQVVPGADGSVDLVASPDGTEGESQEVVASRFTQLITIADNSSVETEFNNKSIRGRVQNNASMVEAEPVFVVSYYTAPTELKQSADYIREVTDLNNTRSLRFLLQVTNREPRIDDDDEIKRHFESIDYYTSYLSTHTPRPIDYFGRGMDYMSVHNYRAAMADFGKALELEPKFTLALMMRGIARYRDLKTDVVSNGEATGAMGHNLRMVIDDLLEVCKLSPDMAVNYFNLGTLYAEAGDMTTALSYFNRAVELKPDFGEAYYNRGYVYFKLGNKAAGTADLSKAGELGIVPSYNLLKRMSAM